MNKFLEYIKRNAVIIIYVLTLISDMITQFTTTLDLTPNQLNILKMVGAIVAVVLTQLQAIKVEKVKND